MAEKREPGWSIRKKPKAAPRPAAETPWRVPFKRPEGTLTVKPKPKVPVKVRTEKYKPGPKLPFSLDLPGAKPARPSIAQLKANLDRRDRQPLTEDQQYKRDVADYWRQQGRPGTIRRPGYQGFAAKTFKTLDKLGVDSQPFRTVDEWVLGIGAAESAAARLGDAWRGDGEFSGWDVADAALALPMAGPVDNLLARPAKAAMRGARAATPQAIKRPVKKLGERLTRVEPLVDRPAYTRSKEGPFTVVKRSGLKPEANPDVLAAKTLGGMRPVLRNSETNPALRLANEEALRVRGAPLGADDAMPTTSLARQGGMGRAFQEAASENPAYQHAVFERYGEMFPEVVEGAKAQNYDQLREAAYSSLGREVTEQFDRLPIALRYHEGAGEYGAPSDMLRDAIGQGQLNVFSGGDPHEFLSKIDPQTGLSQNEMFRGVHDYIGHGATGSTFRPGGEEIAYATHQRTLSPLSQLALLSETRGQNSWVNYGTQNADLIAKMNDVRAQMYEKGKAESLKLDRDFPYWMDRGLGDALDLPPVDALRSQLRELGSRFEYAPQKAVLMPPEYLDPMSPGGTPDWLRSVYDPEGTSARGVHISRQEGLPGTDPSFFGTGHRGAEYQRTKGVLPDRTYFYTGEPGTVVPEPAVMGQTYGGDMVRGPRFAYEGDLSGLYDIDADPEGLRKLAEAYNLPGRRSTLPEMLTFGKNAEGAPNLGGRSSVPDMERLVRDYGYKGYVTGAGNQRAAAVYDPVENLRAILRGDKGFAAGGRVKAKTSCGCS